MIVWVLIIYATSYQTGGGPTVITDIATREECLSLGNKLIKHTAQNRRGNPPHEVTASCYSFRKARL